MKLCPKCEFIYEDDQSFCDMDGKELVYDPGPLAFEENAPASPPELREPAIPANLSAGLPAGQSTGWQFRRSAVAAFAAIILAALLVVVYYARTHQPRAGSANQASNQTSIPSANQSTQLETAAPEPAPEVASAPPASLSSSQEQSSSEAPKLTKSSPSSLSISPAASFSRGRVVSAGGSAADSRAPVVIWLTNGASIKADEAWEKKEGIWYRQAGMVTFLKRSRVRAIQRVAAPNPRSNSTASNAEEKNRKPENAIAENQPRVGKPEAVSAKKESRVGSFLKKTGRILKKPFKF